MKLPHVAPLRFANRLLNKDEDSICVELVFPFAPSLAMICEGVAQATSGFGEGEKLGFLVSLKNVKQLSRLKNLTCEACIKKGVELGSMSEYIFEVKADGVLHVRGCLVIAF